MSTTHTYTDQGGQWAYAVDLDAMALSVLSDDCDQVMPIWVAGRNLLDYIDARDWQTVDDTLALHDTANYCRHTLTPNYATLTDSTATIAFTAALTGLPL
jgi:hypothetical protein